MNMTDGNITTTHPIVTGDGHTITVEHVERRSTAPPGKGPVLLVHGAGVRANIFRPPVESTLVDTLLDAGYDVWLENWRASIDLPPCEWTLDDGASFDHPAAVQKVLARTRADSLQAIVHCQGSTSFTMSAVAGLLPGVRTIISNAVSLHPVIPRVSKIKIGVAAPLLSLITPYMNPAWGDAPPNLLARAIRAVVRMTHRECSNDVCRMVSFTYGTGFPCLWSHDNLDADTHDWIRREFAAVPFTFFAQMRRSVARGHMVPARRASTLPPDLATAVPKTDARFVLLAGRRNLCFLPESQQRTFEHLDRHQPGRHRLHVFDDYGHLDVFIGQRAAHDIFPTILEALEPGAH